jgi:rare lipoprotein A
MREILLLSLAFFAITAAHIYAIQIANQYDQVGIASWYGPGFHGKLTSTREVYDMYKMTAAHKTIPLGAVVRVTNLKTNQSVVVRINDCGPFVEPRIIDMSYASAKELDMIGPGTIKVGIKIIQLPDPLPEKKCPLKMPDQKKTTEKKKEN